MAIAVPNQVRVTTDNVNIRSRPSLKSKVIDQVLEGEVLFVVAHSDDGKWLKVEAPGYVNVWVYRKLVKEEKVAASKLKVRSGPGINYKDIAILEKDTKLTVREIRGDWMKIAPPQGCAVWIYREYVEPVMRNQVDVVQSLTEKNTNYHYLGEHDGEDPALKLKEPSIFDIIPKLLDWEQFSKAPFSSNLLVVSRAQTRIAAHIGVLSPTGMTFWRKPSPYRLILRDARGKAVTKCYVIINEETFKLYKGKFIEVSGVEYMAQGAREPVITVKKISEFKLLED